MLLERLDGLALEYATKCAAKAEAAIVKMDVRASAFRLLSFIPHFSPSLNPKPAIIMTLYEHPAGSELWQSSLMSGTCRAHHSVLQAPLIYGRTPS